jgi:Contractile injection system tube protein
MEFKKAYLEEVSPQPTATQPQAQSPKIEVQINPATLRYQMASTVDFGKDAGRQKTTYQGSTSTLSFDLVFDTADEGDTANPVDVRTRTRQLERFVLPNMKQPKAAPPRLQFTYGTFTVIGVMTTLNQDFDLFSATGVPLRAKCAVTIKEQKPEFDATLAGPGANTGAGATPPVPAGAGPGATAPGAPGTGVAAPPAAGTTSPAPTDRTGTALANETASNFAQRMGLDPRAWKGLQGITDPLRLQAGQQINFSSSLSSTTGIGVEVGATAGLGTGPGPSGTGAAPPSAAGAAASASGAVPAQLQVDGTDLTAAGGLARALDRTAAATAASAASVTRQAFALGPGPSGSAASPGTTPTPASAAAAPAGPSAAAAVSTTDPRALGYGFGVPLRPRLGVTGPITVGLVRELDSNVASGGDQPPQTSDPTVPGWLALSAAPAGSAAAATATASAAGCGCGGTP